MNPVVLIVLAFAILYTREGHNTAFATSHHWVRHFVCGSWGGGLGKWGETEINFYSVFMMVMFFAGEHGLNKKTARLLYRFCFHPPTT